MAVFLSHTVLHKHRYTLTQGPMGSGVCTTPPPPPPPPTSPPLLSFSLSHSLSLDSFSDMPAQAHLAAHTHPPRPPSTHHPSCSSPPSLLPSLPPFTFLPCDISMATWKETSVLGEQCDGAGCKGWGGGCSKEAQDKKGIEGSGGCTVCPPRETRAPLAWQQPPPPLSEVGLNARGTGTEWVAVTQ